MMRSNVRTDTFVKMEEVKRGERSGQLEAQQIIDQICSTSTWSNRIQSVNKKGAGNTTSYQSTILWDVQGYKKENFV